MDVMDVSVPAISPFSTYIDPDSINIDAVEEEEEILIFLIRMKMKINHRTLQQYKK